MRSACPRIHAVSLHRCESSGKLVVQADATSIIAQQQITTLAIKHHLPAIYQVREFVQNGGLISYGPSITEVIRRSAMFVDKILKGIKPTDLPIEQPTKFELVST